MNKNACTLLSACLAGSILAACAVSSDPEPPTPTAGVHAEQTPVAIGDSDADAASITPVTATPIAASCQVYNVSCWYDCAAGPVAGQTASGVCSGAGCCGQAATSIQCAPTIPDGPWTTCSLTGGPTATVNWCIAEPCLPTAAQAAPAGAQ